jgi:hypothetical protein
MRLERITEGAGREGSTLGLQRSYRSTAGMLQFGKKHNWPTERFERIRQRKEGMGAHCDCREVIKNNREAT